MTRVLKLVTPPATEPVTLAELKAWAKVETSDDDTLLTSLIAAAREAAELYTRRAFITQTWRMTLDLYPSRLNDWLGEGTYDLPVTALYDGMPNSVRLPKGEIIAVTSVTTYDTSNVATVYDAANYRLGSGQIILNSGATWPTALRPQGGTEILFTAGYGNAAAVPQGIKTAILMHAALMYDSRTICELPAACERLLRMFRIRDGLAHA